MQGPLTILQVGAFPFPTHQGSQVYVAGMVRALARRGHRVILACYADRAGADPEGVEVVRARRIPGGQGLRSGPHWSRFPQDLSLGRTVRRILRDQHIDVIHAHNVEAPLLVWGRRDVPLIYNLHTLMEEELPAYFRGPFRRPARRIGQTVDWVVPAHCDAGIAISPTALDALMHHGLRRVAYVPPGVDLQELDGGDALRARHRWGIGDRPQVVYTGNADPYQDLPILFEAMAAVDAELLVVTGSPTGPLERLAERWQIPARIVHSTDFADTLDALAVATVAALPRSQCAGFPIKLLNQLGMGVPTVAAVGSVQSIPGMVAVPNSDPAAMAREISALVADRERLRQLSDAAREAIAADWTWDAQAARLEAFYRTLVGTPPDT